MSKSLKTLIKISKSEVDKLQKELAELVKRQDIFRAEAARLNREIEQEREVANNFPDNPEIALGYTNFAIAAKNRIDFIVMEINSLEQKIEIKRDELREAFSEQKKYEIVQATKLQKQAQELSRKENNRLDEIGISVFIRNENAE